MKEKSRKKAPKEKNPLETRGRKTALNLTDPKIISQIEIFGRLGSTQEEMANFFRVHRHTIMAYLKDEDSLFYDTYKKAEADLNSSLRRAQVKKAVAGDNTMLIWLGKQRLGQKEKVQYSGNAEEPLVVLNPDMPANEAFNVYKDFMKDV